MKTRFFNKQAYFSGFSPRVLAHTLKNLPSFLKDVRQYRQMNPPEGFRIRYRDLFPILTDRTASAGYTGDHYFYQDLWAARKIHERKPREHVDVGSRIDGFIAHLLTFRSVTVIDIRPLESKISGLTFLHDDATEMEKVMTDSIESLSSLHVAEHFGLGRYGDPVDPHACFRFMATLQRVLAPGGTLYFSVPLGRERVEFNAHRVFAPQTVLRQFSRLKLLSFSFIADEGCLYENQDPLEILPSEFACGLFEFTKPLPEQAEK
jgi:hypothetical protein